MKKFIIASKSSPLARGVAGGTRRGVAKKFIVAITLALCAFGVRAENETQIATSVGYVTEELETRQDKFNKFGANTAMTYSGSTDGAIGSRTITGDLGAETNTTNTALPTVGAVNTKLDNKQDELDFAANTVLMNTGTAGAPAAKGIYDDSGSYADQQSSLIEAATFNAALQNAINSEFTCAQRKDPNDPTSKCLLFNIFTPTTNLMIPDTYTRLEYLESTATQYIDTGIFPSNNIGVSIKYALKEFSPYSYIFGSFIPHYYLGIDGTKTWLRLSYGPTGSAPVFDIPIANIEIDKQYELNINLYNSGIAEFVGITSARLMSRIFSDENRKMSLFMASAGSNYSKAKVYYLKMTDGTTLVRDFIPAKRNSDGVLGMYDTVSETFFTNAGSGTFIAGPELSSNIYLPMN